MVTVISEENPLVVFNDNVLRDLLRDDCCVLLPVAVVGLCNERSS